MSRPTARLCADCLSGVLRPRGLLAAPARRGTPRRVRIAESRRGLHGAQGCRPVGYIAGHDVHQRGNMKGLPGPCEHVRQFATVGENKGDSERESKKSVPEDGPLKEYENRIAQGRLRSDPYQRRRFQNWFLATSVGDS